MLLGLQRGGAWVVLDPSINSEQMEMYADVDARAGVLGKLIPELDKYGLMIISIEPEGIVEIKSKS
jgi:hypothetical protein